MIGFLSGISMKVWGYAAVALGVLVAILKIFSAGKTAARVEGMKEQLQNASTRAKVDDAVAGASEPERSKLRDKWQRD